MPPLPKHPSLRRRSNRSSTAAVLRAVPDAEAPDLPAYCDWHPAVQEWWADVWSSPMVSEWTGSDRHVLVMAARLMQVVWEGSTAATPRSNASSEVRLLLRECGLTPMARRSLQWTIEQAEAAVERTERRRAAQVDPRMSMRDGGA